MLKLTLTYTGTWSADGFVYVNPDAIAAVARTKPRGARAVEHTDVMLRAPDEEGAAISYAVAETPDAIAALILEARRAGY